MYVRTGPCRKHALSGGKVAGQLDAGAAAPPSAAEEGRPVGLPSKAKATHEEAEVAGDGVTGDGVGIAERTVYDSLVEDMRRSLRFYAKQTGQSFFLKIFLTGGAASTPGLTGIVNEKLNIECAVFDPFESMVGAEDVSTSNPSQFTTALGLGIRGGMDVG